MKAEHRESDDILNEHHEEHQKELDYIKGKNEALTQKITNLKLKLSQLETDLYNFEKRFIWLTYISALDCDLKDLPVIQQTLKQIKNDNPGFF